MLAPKSLVGNDPNGRIRHTVAVSSAPTERRRHPRVPANLLIQYRFDTFDAFVVDYIEDISEGGVLIRDPELVRPVGATVYVQFVLRDGTMLIEGLARVVRIDEASPRSMALAFIDFGEDAKIRIRRLVDERPYDDIPTEDLTAWG